jgi:hypothetical protein
MIHIRPFYAGLMQRFPFRRSIFAALPSTFTMFLERIHAFQQLMQPQNLHADLQAIYALNLGLAARSHALSKL